MSQEGKNEISNIFSRNLKRLRGNRTQAEFAKHLGFQTQAGYSRYENGIVPGQRVLTRIANKLGMDPRDLLTAKPEAKEKPLIPREEDSSSAVRVPLVSWAAAGAGHDYEDLCKQLEEWVRTDVKDRNAFAVTIEGDSMEQYVSAGDRVVFSPNSTAVSGDPVIVKTKDGAVLFKWYYSIGDRGERVRLESENAAYKLIEINREDIDWIYPAKDIKRSVRRKPRGR